MNATVLIIAVISSTWHNVWMAEHGREIAVQMRKVGTEVSEGRQPLAVLTLVVFVAVMREGSEIVLFLYGIVFAAMNMASLLTGGAIGFSLERHGVVDDRLTALPTRYIFSVTSVLIALLAAGMAAQAVRFLQAAGVITALRSKVWYTSWILRP